MNEDPPVETRYAGLITRAVALLVDAAAINVIASHCWPAARST